MAAGDAIVLERWTEDRFKLHMHIIKSASDEAVAAVTTGRSKAKRGTARTVQRVTKPRSPAKRSPRVTNHSTTASQGHSPGKGIASQGYSPSRGQSSALEALHDAALLCADSVPLTSNPETNATASGRNLAPTLNRSQPVPYVGSMVSAAAVAAADAAAVSNGDAKLAVATGYNADQVDLADRVQGRKGFENSSLDRISDSIMKAVS